ncbi:MAG: hypothetical protein R3E79_28080 [Caldilineaceae bacterium]
MKLIPRYFMLLFAIVLTACVPIQAPIAAPAAAAPANADAAATTGPVAELSGEFDLVQLIVDFPPAPGRPCTRMAACYW